MSFREDRSAARDLKAGKSSCETREAGRLNDCGTKRACPSDFGFTHQNSRARLRGDQGPETLGVTSSRRDGDGPRTAGESRRDGAGGAVRRDVEGGVSGGYGMQRSDESIAVGAENDLAKMIAHKQLLMLEVQNREGDSAALQKKLELALRQVNTIRFELSDANALQESAKKRLRLCSQHIHDAQAHLNPSNSSMEVAAAATIDQQDASTTSSPLPPHPPPAAASRFSPSSSHARSPAPNPGSPGHGQGQGQGHGGLRAEGKRGTGDAWSRNPGQGQGHGQGHGDRREHGHHSRPRENTPNEGGGSGLPVPHEQDSPDGHSATRASGSARGRGKGRGGRGLHAPGPQNGSVSERNSRGSGSAATSATSTSTASTGTSTSTTRRGVGPEGLIIRMPPPGSSLRSSSADTSGGGMRREESVDGILPAPLRNSTGRLERGVRAGPGRRGLDSEAGWGRERGGGGDQRRSLLEFSRQVEAITHRHNLRCLEFNPVTMNRFVVASNDRALDMWEYDPQYTSVTRIKMSSDATPFHVGSMRWNPSGTHLASGMVCTGPIVGDKSCDLAITQYTPNRDLKTTRHFTKKHSRPAYAVAWMNSCSSQQGNLVTGGDDKRVVAWMRVLETDPSVRGEGVLHEHHTSAIRSLCCPTSTSLVISGGMDSRLISYDVVEGSLQWNLLLRNTDFHPTVNEVLEFPNSPQELLISTVDTAKSHTMFRLDRRDPHSYTSMVRWEWRRTDATKSYSVSNVPRLSPCGTYMTCAGWFNSCVYIWDTRAGRGTPMQTLSIENAPKVAHTAWHPDSKRSVLFSLANNGTGSRSKCKSIVVHPFTTRR